MEVASAIRLPSPAPADAFTGQRKRSPPSRSPSPSAHRRRTRSPDDDAGRSPSPYTYRRSMRSPDHRNGRSRSPTRRARSRSLAEPSAPLPRDFDQARARERQRQFEMRQRQDEVTKPELTEAEKKAAAQKEYNELLSKRSGGMYVPPARLRQLQAQIGDDPKSKEYQRMAWEALKKSINGLINKVNVGNIKMIVPELFGENLVKGRGLFCRSIMRAQAASLPFTPVFAATVAIVNTKLPQVGELLVKRLVAQFRKAFKRNDKAVCISSTTFLSHLVNFQVLNELLVAQILLLLLAKPTDDSVEIAVNVTKLVGQHLEEYNAAVAVAVFDQMRNILNEATELEKRTQYMIEVLFLVRKSKYKDNPAIPDELDLVEEEDQITHQIDLEGEIDVQTGLDIFKFDSEYEEHEQAYQNLKAQILGEAEDSGEEEDGDEDDESSEDEEEAAEIKAMEIKDQTNTDLVNLRRSIYLTIKSASLFEEAVHKLMKVNLPVGLEKELPSMVIECASQERTYEKYYGGIAERFCKLNRLWTQLFEELFTEYYETIHRYETNRLRIIAQLFGHLFSTDAIGWHCMSVIKLTQEDTTSSSRIFIKILFEELALNMGMGKLVEIMKDDILRPSLAGLFPTDDPKNTRFAINYFTAIQMGALTEDMRVWLQNLPKAEPKPLPESDSDSDSADSYSSYSSRSRSRSRSRPARRIPARRRRDSYSDSERSSRSPPPRSRRAASPERPVRPRSYTRSVSASRSRSRSPPPRRRSTRYQSSPSRSLSRSQSRSRGPLQRRNRSLSRSPSSSRSRSLPPRRREERDRSVSSSRSPPRRRPARRPSSSNASRPPPRRSARERDERRSRSNDRASHRRRSPSSEVENSGAPRGRGRRNTSSGSDRSRSGGERERR